MHLAAGEGPEPTTDQALTVENRADASGYLQACPRKLQGHLRTAAM